jgi:hypothetical protein
MVRGDTNQGKGEDTDHGDELGKCDSRLVLSLFVRASARDSSGKPEVCWPLRVAGLVTPA